MDTTGTTKAAMDQTFKNALVTTAPDPVNPKTGNTYIYDGMRAIFKDMPEKQADYERERKANAVEVVGDWDRDCESIDGKKVVRHFYQPHCGWEMDQHCWLTEDGRIWGTNHGRIYEMSPQELAELDEQVDAWARGVHDAREEAKLLRAQRKEERG